MLPPYYFRTKENGAAVFRVEEDARNRRIEMRPIASVNVRSGEVRAQGGRDLKPADRAAIQDWLAERRRTLARRDAARARETVDRLNLTAQWAQSRAAPDELDAVTDALLLAMHDLRTVLVRKKAERMED